MHTINWLAIGTTLAVPVIVTIACPGWVGTAIKAWKNLPSVPAQGNLNALAKDIAKRHVDDPHYIRYN